MTVIKVLEEMKLPFQFKIVKKHIVKQKRCLKFIMFIQIWIKYFLKVFNNGRMKPRIRGEVEE